VAQRIRQMFAAMGRTMPENNLKQAQFPEGAVILPNALGTAPGYRLTVETAWGLRHAIVMPGVPREMQPMLTEQVLPWLRTARGTTDVYVSHTFQTFGISESALDELVAGAVDPAEGRLAFRAAFPQVSLRVTVHGAPAVAAARLAQVVDRLRARLGEYCYGEGDTSMEAEVGRLLRECGWTIALAESCTGGLIGHRLTNVPGSSAYLLGGVVAYGNQTKADALGVAAVTLEAHGAVSVEVAREMAAGARRQMAATLGLAVTGIAGPAGGTPEKPVGTVCIALATPAQIYAQRYQLWGTRDWVKLLASQIALDWVRRACLGRDPTESGILRK
jgi:nicotinamide-nucleotide amidase